MKSGVCKVKYLERNKIVSYGILYDTGEFEVMTRDDYKTRVESGELSVSNIVSSPNGFKVSGDTDLVLVIDKPYSNTRMNIDMVDTGALHNKYFNCADVESAENKMLVYFDTLCRMISSYTGCEYNPYFIKRKIQAHVWETPDILSYGFVKYKIFVCAASIHMGEAINLHGKEIKANGDYIIIGVTPASKDRSLIEDGLAYLANKHFINVYSVSGHTVESIYTDFIDRIKSFTKLGAKSVQLDSLHTKRFMTIVRRVGNALGIKINFRNGELGVGKDKVYLYRDTNVIFGSDENESYDISLILSRGANGAGRAYFHLIDNSSMDKETETRGRAVEITVNDLNALDIAVETYIYYAKELIEHKNFGGTLVID